MCHTLRAHIRIGDHFMGLGNSLKGNCHELRMRLSKFACGNIPGFLATFRSQNLL